MGNDLITIIVLDIWKNANEKVKRDKSIAQKLNAARADIEKEMQSQSMDEEHWLLLYEARLHRLFNADINVGNTSPLFKKMEELGISFYEPSVLGKS